MGSCLISRCRLSEVRDWKVLLLEAGGEEPNLADIPAFQPFTEQSRLNWYYDSVPDSRFCGGKSCAFTTGKGLGGGSLHNEMLYSRGNSRIFNMWEDIGVFCTVTHSCVFTYPPHSLLSLLPLLLPLLLHILLLLLSLPPYIFLLILFLFFTTIYFYPVSFFS